MLFKKFAVAAAIATTLAFVGCSKKEEAPATDAAAAASEAVEAATEATDAAAEATEAAADATVAAASDVAVTEAAPVEASAAQ